MHSFNNVCFDRPVSVRNDYFYLCTMLNITIWKMWRWTWTVIPVSKVFWHPIESCVKFYTHILMGCLLTCTYDSFMKCNKISLSTPILPIHVIFIVEQQIFISGSLCLYAVLLNHSFCFIISGKVLVHSSLREIQSALAEVLGGPQFLRSFVVTPYHYDICK